MSSNHAEGFVTDLLALADVKIGGDRPWDLEVHDPGFYGRVLAGGSLALGESYMAGEWDCASLDEFFHRVISARLDQKVHRGLGTTLLYAKERLSNRQRKSKAGIVGEHHYDLGNDLFKNMLDRRMVYSCAYWKDAETLEQAQEKKLDLICRKLALAPGMHILDIGCGWGGFARFAAERYGVRVTGVNNSRRQVVLGQEMTRGLPVEIRYQDYRDIEGSFDRIASIGMFEHVGPKNYSTFMDVVGRCMKDDGICVLHTIGANRTSRTPDAWTEKYIFPRSKIPSPSELSAAIEEQFVMEDWHNLSANYDPTLLAWYKNFYANWDKLRDRYGEPFFRMWRYYLLSCAGAFRARLNQVWQVVLSKRGVKGGYPRIR